MCVQPIRLLQHKEKGLTVPCGFCIECRSRYARQWAIRCVHEASLHEESCFVTLTYSQEKLPADWSLDKRALQLFMKRLRKWISPRRLKFYAVGEYGDANGRPHYHLLLFGYQPVDGIQVGERAGVPLFRSATLEALWPDGMSAYGAVSFESASYVTRYIMKKVDQVGRKRKWRGDPETGEVNEIEPEYSTMSRGGRDGRGLGFGWYQKYGEEVERLESVVVAGAELQPPRYYDELLRERDAARFELMKFRRARKRARYVPSRELLAREVIARRRFETLAARAL